MYIHDIAHDMSLILLSGRLKCGPQPQRVTQACVRGRIQQASARPPVLQPQRSLLNNPLKVLVSGLLLLVRGFFRIQLSENLPFLLPLSSLAP